MIAEQQSVRRYPSPYGVNLAHVLGCLVRGDELGETCDTAGILNTFAELHHRDEGSAKDPLVP